MTIARQARFDDIAGIIELMKRNEMEFRNKDPEEWHNIWKKNPLFSELESAWPIGWVLEDGSGKIVGFMGNIPLVYLLGPKRLIAASATSWVVDYGHRNHSIVLLTHFMGQKNVDILLDTTASDTAQKIFAAFKASELPVASYERVLFAIIDYCNFTASTFRRYGLILPRLLIRPIALIIYLSDLMTGKIRNFKKIVREDILQLNVFDNRFDIFWSKLSQGSKKLLAIRDSKWLGWHFGNAVENKKAWIFVKKSGPDISAYAVFIRKDNPKINLKRLKLADYQTLDDDPAILEEMLLCAVAKCREEKIDVLESSGFNADKEEILQKLLSRRRKLANWHFIYQTQDKKLREELQDSGVWDPSLYDGDGTL